MEKYIIDERNGLEYELIGDFYYPTGRRMKDGLLTPAERPEESQSEEKLFIGPWAQRHLSFLKEHRLWFYLELFAEGKANTYLAQIEQDASDLFLWLVKEMAAKEGITEQLKADDQMAWVGAMNNIRERATEIVNHELIYN